MDSDFIVRIFQLISLGTSLRHTYKCVLFMINILTIVAISERDH